MGTATVKPHRVKPGKSWYRADKTTVRREGEAFPKGTVVESSYYKGPTECPDCGRGLLGRGHDWMCYSLAPGAGLESAEGGVWACGVKGDG